MSGRARLAIFAAVATLASACALLPLVDPVRWMFQAALLVCVQSAVGTAARRVPLARPLTVAAQAVVSLLLITAVFAREQALGGVLPSPQAFQELGLLMRDGADDVGRYAIPAPLTDGIRLLLVGGVLVIGLAVDALAVTYRSAAPAGLPLLALFSVAAGLSDDGHDWLWFLLAAGGYLLLLLAEGRDRLSQWGRLFPGGGPRSPERMASGLAAAGGGDAALAPVRTGRRIGALALGIALAVPAVLPSLNGGLLDRRGNGEKGGGGSTISAVNPLVSLQNSLNQPENREVLSYRTTSDTTQDLYLRIVALDQFDGTAWKPSERRVTDVPETLPRPPGLGSGIRTTEITTSVSAARWYAQSWLPLPYPATKVDIEGRWRFEPEGRTLVGDRGQSTKGARYQVSSLRVQPTADQLAAAPAPPSRLLREYTQVPDSLPPVVRQTADEVTAGARNAYEKAVKLQDWFSYKGGFTYDTQVRAGTGSQAIARFLEQKEGFCVHFSFSMAAMARTLGIPARVAVGFTPGTKKSNGAMSVGIKDAHAWPELYFEGVGWTRFEPTPSRGSQPDYTIEPIPSDDDPEVPAPRPSGAERPSTAAPSPSDSCPPDARKLGDCGAAPPAPSDDDSEGGGGWISRTATIVGFGALACLLIAIPLAPMLWRLRTRTRRLNGSGGRTPEDAADRTLAAWRELVDTAWDYGIVPDDAQTSRRAVDRIAEAGRLDPAATEAAGRVAQAVEQVLYAPLPRPVTGLADDVRRVITGLRASAGRRVRWRALLAPRSAVRLVWAGPQRWSTWADRWGRASRRWTRWSSLPRRTRRQRG
ncbi:transglutaminase TgpA family protein [Streptomyces sp. P1-3]|uniref:transglutaminase TgpA family protein n=1 Tax=Streptomyces sp. P1-3 TaxID=3421658 RepID=UPI003D35FD52